MMSSEGRRSLQPNEADDFPYVIQISPNVEAHKYIGQGGWHPMLKRAPLDWLMNKNNVIDRWYCEYIRLTPTNGYPVIRFKSVTDAVMFRLSF